MHKKFQEQAKQDCVFCNPSSELVLLVTEHFMLMLDPFALVEGHLLITSRAHYGCLGEIPINLYDSLIELRELAYAYLKNAFNTSIVRYEHGRAGHCLIQDITTRTCHHYHEHLVPANISLHTSLTPRFKCITFRTEQEIIALFERYNEYLLVVEPNGEKHFYVAKSKKVEPHLLRTLTAEALGHIERQNWESYESCELMSTGKNRLLEVIKELQPA